MFYHNHIYTTGIFKIISLIALMHLIKATCHRHRVFPPQVSCHPIGLALHYGWHTVDNLGPTVNQRWAGVSCLLRVFSHLMLFDIIFYHRSAVKSPFLRMGGI